MEKIVREISKYVLDRGRIPDDLLYEFSMATIKIIEEHTASHLPDEFWKLENYVESYWRGGKYEGEKSVVRVYQMGQLLSYINMLSSCYATAETEATIEEYAEIYRDKYCFFQCIFSKSGITHQELASKMKVSASSLSQFVGRIKENGFFLSRVMGREKHYYLTDKGEKLLKIMSKERMPYNYRYAKLLDEWNNFDRLSESDEYYRTVYGNSKEFYTKTIYACDNEEERIGHQFLFKVSMNKQILEQESEMEEVCKILVNQKSKKIS